MSLLEILGKIRTSRGFHRVLRIFSKRRFQASWERFLSGKQGQFLSEKQYKVLLHPYILTLFLFLCWTMAFCRFLVSHDISGMS